VPREDCVLRTETATHRDMKQKNSDKNEKANSTLNMLQTCTPALSPQLLVEHDCVMVWPIAFASSPKATPQRTVRTRSTTMTATAETVQHRNRAELMTRLINVRAAARSRMENSHGTEKLSCRRWKTKYASTPITIKAHRSWKKRRIIKTPMGHSEFREFFMMRTLCGVEGGE